tara:strand:+ start:582 stop:830 length:249 start_codon:yes stop_codon:yes gene_type:complete
VSSERVQQQVEGLSNVGKSIETLAYLIQKKGGDMSITRDKEGVSWSIAVTYPAQGGYTWWTEGLPGDTLDKLANRVNGRFNR